MNIFQKSFASGELTPSLYGRVDLLKYSTGLRTMRNFFVARHGSAYNRPGSAYCAPVKTHNSTIRLIRFDVDSATKYQLEFGHNYIRPLKDGKPISVGSKAIFSISKAANAVVGTTLYHGFKVGDVVTFSGVTGMTQMNGLTGTISAISLVSFTVNIDSTGFSTFTPNTHVGTVALVTPRYVEVTTTFNQLHLRQLVYVQENREMTITHQSYYPQVIKYYGPETWTIGNVSTDPVIASPSGLTSSKPAGTVFYHAVTAVNADTFEESLPTTIGSNAAPTSGSPTTISWGAVAGAIEYNVYGGTSPTSMGLLSVVYTNSFVDDASRAPNFSDTFPTARTMFYTGDTAMLPASVGFFQQRKWYGNIGPQYAVAGPPTIIPAGWDPKADRIIASRIGSPTYFLLKRPVEEDDSMVFRLLNKEPQIIRHFLDLGKLVVFTEQGEWILKGNLDGAITPSEINPTNVSQNGIGYLAPIAIGNTALYVQKKGSIIRTFGFEFQVEGYRGDDVTIYSSHLTEGHQIIAWDFQKLPHPIVWSVREDGMLLGCTFVPEQAILAWHRHDFTNGKVHDVLQSDDQVYLVIERVINGNTVKYIEKLNTREFTSIKDAIFMDSSVTWNGTPPTYIILGVSYTISGGTAWDENELLTITASSPVFTAGDFANGKITGLHFDDGSGGLLRFEIDSITNGTTLVARPNKTVPVGMRNTPLAPSAYASNNIQGLSHLEGQEVSVIGDGFVLSSPNNDDYPTFTVTGGVVNLGDTSYGVVHVGLPITADLETLNIDTAQANSILDRKKLITKVSMWVEKSRGIFVGGVPPDDESQDGLMPAFDELKARYEEGYDQPNNLITRVVEINIQAQWNSHGRVFVRQIDPLPLAILSIAPGGLVPIGEGNG